ncbi:voltage-dependent calcium channel subunit alpha-2/delta-3-like isoform X1 [Varroa jacobsoni]|nr:voltage-dependent calcium channel subunit alpha-2/delta-3-like isoform X1 [Varroa jacobsoni]
MHAIRMSSELDNRFRANRGSDPYLSFQFFCSHTGFLRLYPAVQWPDMEPDMYECRSRSWYVQAAASAKDIVILLDVSGSMTGLRKEIARNVVINILETLTDNDFVQVLTFKNDCLPLVPCFDMPVQANQRNIREFKEYLNKLDTQNIANFSSALTEAFELLQRFNRSKGGSQCNQAIMLITDGAPSNYQDIFFRYNYPNIPVRVFTYLIGREVTDTREVNWMACSNRGYYTHVTTLAEVREQVLKYIPVMSRPIVLARKHPVIWTAAYPTVTEILLTDNLWEERERARFKAEGLRNLRRRMQRDSHVRDQNNTEYYYDTDDYEDEDEDYDNKTQPLKSAERSQRRRKRSPEEGPSGAGGGAKSLRANAPIRGDVSYISLSDQLALRPENRDYPETKKRKPLMLTTVAIPVFNISKGENDTNATSHLLGVVGVDVPVRELERLASPFQLGVNAYPLILNKNGHLISHPDLRPMFQDFVKPFHSNVDLLEVELLDSQLSARDFSQTFKDLRKNMIDGRRGWTEPHNVRVHMDGMKRVAVRKQRYYYGPVGNSVFALAIALPQPYGSYGVEAQFELSNPANLKIDVYKQFFEGTDWHVHPNWTYCEDDNAERGWHNIEKRGIDRVQRNAIASLLKAWRTERNPKFSPEPNRPNKMHQFKTWTCDLDLLQSLIHDATRTAPHILEQVKSQHPPASTKSRARDVLTQSNGIISAFVATRSGLLRVQTFLDQNISESEKFYNKYPRSIDELFYKRAVDFYYHSNASKEAFVYSVPFDAGESLQAEGTPIVMTATRVVMLGNSENATAPVAVVGVQIDHQIFTEKFFNSTLTACDQVASKDCKFKCNSEASGFDCYLLDSNGFIISTANSSDVLLVGKFFGEVDAAVFNQLIKYNIFKKVTIYDYQAVCFDKKPGQASASRLLNPFKSVLNGLMFLLNTFVTNIVKMAAIAIDTEWWFHEPLRAFGYDNDAVAGDDGDNPHPGMSFTQVRPCDREIDLYIMANLGENPTFGNVHQCNVACNHTFIVQPVYDSNMLMVAIPHACQHCERERLRLEPHEALLPESNVTTACVKTPLHRQRPDTCYNYHAAPDRRFRTNEPICEEGYSYFYKKFACEKEMLRELDLKEQCGSSTTSSLSWPLLLLCGLLTLLLRHRDPFNVDQDINLRFIGLR